MRMRKYQCFVFIITAVMSSAPAWSAVCTVNLEQAYQKAVANGWAFSCSYGVVKFDNYKRVGCYVKTGVAPAVLESGFFWKQGSIPSGQAHNGWRVHSYKIANGEYKKIDGGTGQLIHIQFTVKGPWKTGSRHVSELKLMKDSGDCSKVLDEAF